MIAIFAGFISSSNKFLLVSRKLFKDRLSLHSFIVFTSICYAL